MKTIDTLVEDIHNLLDGNSPMDFLDKHAEAFGERMKTLVTSRVGPSDYGPPSLRISNIGKPCERQVWYGIHKSDTAEPLSPSTRLKFLYGDLIEELLLFLAEMAGHKVEGQQDRMVVEGVVGHRDAVIDGVLVDVKSASTFSFKKFEQGALKDSDAFGYIGQIQTYLEACQDDPIVTDKDRCAFFVMDKTLGHICLDVHERMKVDIKAITRGKVDTMSKDTPPDRAFAPVAEGASGNQRLGMECSYCAFKKECYPQMRTFLYSNGPKFLTTVKKVPNVPEVA